MCFTSATKRHTILMQVHATAIVFNYIVKPVRFFSNRVYLEYRPVRWVDLKILEGGFFIVKNIS